MNALRGEDGDNYYLVVARHIVFGEFVYIKTASASNLAPISLIILDFRAIYEQ